MKNYKPQTWLELETNPENTRFNKALDGADFSIARNILDFLESDKRTPITSRTLTLARIRLGDVFTTRPTYSEINSMRENFGLAKVDPRIAIPLRRTCREQSTTSRIVVGHEPLMDDFGESFLYFGFWGGRKQISLCGADQGSVNGVWNLDYEFVYSIN
jgi:hypothetical protein